jgi:histidine triad (HIT) family protein
MEDSIFTKIIKGEVPAHKIYEDEKTIAFMDIFPIQPGHVLVVPKAQVEDFYALEDDDYQALFAIVKKVATKLKSVFPDKKRIAVQIEGLDVPHVHVKMFPIDTSEQFRSPNSSAEPDHQALAEMATKLKIN